jgi:hypothetical protein
MDRGPMLKPNSSRKIIMYSKDISSLPSFPSSKHLLPFVEDDKVYPRVFPTSKMPLKVALARRIKHYDEYDLSETLKAVDWKQGKSLMDLSHYNF